MISSGMQRSEMEELATEVKSLDAKDSDKWTIGMLNSNQQLTDTIYNLGRISLNLTFAKASWEFPLV